MRAEVRARLERLIAEGRDDGAPEATSLGSSTSLDESTRALDDLSADEAGWSLRRFAGRFERRHVQVVVAVLLVGLLITGGWLIRSREVAAVDVRTVVSVPPEPTAPPPGTPEASPTPEPVKTIHVHVLGAVKNPSVVELPLGSRVSDAITAAGGLTADARPGDLNLAAPVPDGAQIWVGDTATPGGELRPTGEAAPQTSPDGSAEPAEPGGLINLNTATSAQLEQLPGVGPVTAGNIIAWRDENGGFASIDQLQEVPGIGAKTFQRLAPLVTV